MKIKAALSLNHLHNLSQWQLVRLPVTYLNLTRHATIHYQNYLHVASVMEGKQRYRIPISSGLF